MDQQTMSIIENVLEAYANEQPTCPECGSQEVFQDTLNPESATYGQTVCLNCGYYFSD